MNIEIKVIANARKKEIIAMGSGLKVKLTSPARDGKANEELVGYLAEVFGVRKSEIRILRGEKEKKKVVAIPLDEGSFEAFLSEKVKVTIG